MENTGKKYVGTQVDPELHKQIRIRCLERGLTNHEAIVEGLCLLLDINYTFSEQECSTKVVNS